jgi:hypothetical protein
MRKTMLLVLAMAVTALSVPTVASGVRGGELKGNPEGERARLLGRDHQRPGLP